MRELQAGREPNLDAIVASLKRFGQVEPLVVQSATGRIIGGNGRVDAMNRPGWAHCDVVHVDTSDIPKEERNAMFATVMHHLRSPQNVGTIVRTHMAFGGDSLVMVGHDLPWRFKKNTQAFSRKLEKLCEITYLESDEALFEWFVQNDWSPVAVEIRDDAHPITTFEWPERPAVVLGNEGTGLSDRFLDRCERAVRIPQYGPVSCLNVATAYAIAAHEFRRGSGEGRQVEGTKYVAGVRP